MAKQRKMACGEHSQTDCVKNYRNPIDSEGNVAITRGNRNEVRTDTFCDFHRTVINQRGYALNDQMRSNFGESNPRL